MTTLTRLDKAAVMSTAAAAAFKVLLWSVGASLDSGEWWLPGVRWAFALVSFVAFDLVVLAVVQDQRTHGRRWLGTATAGMAALLSGGVALHVAGVLDAPVLHAGPAALLLLLALHLSDVRGASGAPVLAPVERQLPDASSKTARIKVLASAAGVSESAMWRRVKQGKVEL